MTQWLTHLYGVMADKPCSLVSPLHGDLIMLLREAMQSRQSSPWRLDNALTRSHAVSSVLSVWRLDKALTRSLGSNLPRSSGSYLPGGYWRSLSGFPGLRKAIVTRSLPLSLDWTYRRTQSIRYIGGTEDENAIWGGSERKKSRVRQWKIVSLHKRRNVCSEKQPPEYVDCIFLYYIR